MATTGFWPVKSRLKEVIDYAENPDKTIDKKYVDSDLFAALQYAADDKKTDERMYVSGITNQELLCRGWFLPPNTYDCGSFVVHGTAVVGKERNNPYNRWKSTQKGADLYENDI